MAVVPVVGATVVVVVVVVAVVIAVVALVGAIVVAAVVVVLIASVGDVFVFCSIDYEHEQHDDQTKPSRSRIGLGTGRMRIGWGATVAQLLEWPRRRPYIYLETNTKIARAGKIILGTNVKLAMTDALI